MIRIARVKQFLPRIKFIKPIGPAPEDHRSADEVRQVVTEGIECIRRYLLACEDSFQKGAFSYSRYNLDHVFLSLRDLSQALKRLQELERDGR